MKKAEDIKIRTDKMALDIKEMCDQFIDEFGNCDINISSECIYYHTLSEKKYSSTNVEVNITI